MAEQRHGWHIALGLGGLVLVGALAASATAPPHGTDAAAHDIALVHRTLIWHDGQDVEHRVYFGQFDNFDWYFPCTYETGMWTYGADSVLHLTYDNPVYPPQSFKLALAGDTLTLAPPDGGAPSPAEIAEGNKLPFG